MAVTPSGAHVDVSSITFTYGATPTVLQLGECTSYELDDMGTRISKGGGNAPGDTHHKVVGQNRSVSLGGFDIKAFSAVPAGVEGTLEFIINDEHNGEGIGALNVVLSNCMTPGRKVTGKYNEYAEDTMTFNARWTLVSGSYVDPLVVTEVTS